MVFFLKSQWEAQGQSPAPCPWGATAILLCFLEEHTDAAQSEAWKVWSWPAALHFGEWGGKGEFSMVLCNPLGSWVTQWLPRLRQQTPRGWEAGQLCPGKNNASADTEAALFFPGTLNSQMERILEVPQRASSLVREQELAATLMQIHLESHNCPEKSCKWGLGPDQAAGVTSALTGSSSPRFSWGSRFWAIQIHDSQSKI